MNLVREHEISTIPTIELNDGKSIPQLGFGTWLLRDEEAYDCTRTALELGYRHIDTASIYKNEEQIGQAVRDSGIPREEIFVTTKLWNNRHLEAERSIDESLERLGLDYVDLYLIHWPVAGSDNYVTAWKTMETFILDGRARSIGVSNFMTRHLQNLINQTTIVPAINQIEMHPTMNQALVARVNRELGIVTESWSPLGRASEFEVPAIVTIAEETGKTPAQVILRWHIQHGYAIFPKSSAKSRMVENMQIFDFQLNPDQMTILDGLDSGNRIGPDPDTYSF